MNLILQIYLSILGRTGGGTWKEGQDYNASDGQVSEDELYDLYSAERVVIEEFKDEYYKELEGVRVPDEVESLGNFKKGILPMFYKMREVNKLKNKFERSNDLSYDLVILMRPDLLILDKFPNYILQNPNVIWTDKDFVWNFRGYYMLDDSFIASTSSNIDYITSIYSNLEKYWDSELKEFGDMGVPEGYSIEDDPVNVGQPERLLHYHIRRRFVEIMDHDIHKTILRYEDDIFTYRELNPLVMGFLIWREHGIKRFLSRFKIFLSELLDI